jgi:hypothetical protein
MLADLRETRCYHVLTPKVHCCHALPRLAAFCGDGPRALWHIRPLDCLCESTTARQIEL